jgi:2-aminoadipate transaminase
MRYATWTQEVGESFLGEILKTAHYKDIISFAGGLPAQELFPNHDLKECFVKVFEEDGPVALQYAEALGYLPLRQWISTQFPNSSQTREMDEIIITTGSQQGLSLVAQTFIDPGDVVLVESPTYLGALQAFQGFRPNIVMVPCDRDGIIPDALEQLLRKHQPKFLYVIPNYQNPTGRLMSLERRLELVQTARRHNLTILEDNPYGELRYDGEALPNLMDLYEKVIYLGSFSKILSPGLRVGYVIADKEVVRYIERAKEGVDLFSNNLAQHAVYKYIVSNKMNDHILKLRTVYAERRNLMLRAFEEAASEEIQAETPYGGLFLWAKINNRADSVAFLKHAQKEKVIFVPGTFFYPDSRPSNEMRINFSCSSPEAIVEGVKRIAKAVKK